MTRPVLLLIPGMMNTAAVFGPVVELLQDAADIRIADVTTQASVPDMARDALALLADVPAGQPVVVCGYSMGGYVAIELIANNQDWVRTAPVSALFLDTSARPETDETRAMRAKSIAAVQRNYPKVVEALLPYNLHLDSLGNAPLVDALRQDMLALSAETVVRQFHAVMARADHRETLRALAPRTVVACGRADRVTPPELSEELAALVPGARLEWIEDAGHLTPLEQPGRVAALLKTLF